MTRAPYANAPTKSVARNAAARRAASHAPNANALFLVFVSSSPPASATSVCQLAATNACVGALATLHRHHAATDGSETIARDARNVRRRTSRKARRASDASEDASRRLGASATSSIPSSRSSVSSSSSSVNEPATISEPVCVRKVIEKSETSGAFERTSACPTTAETHVDKSVAAFTPCDVAGNARDAFATFSFSKRIRRGSGRVPIRSYAYVRETCVGAYDRDEGDENAIPRNAWCDAKANAANAWLARTHANAGTPKTYKASSFRSSSEAASSSASSSFETCALTNSANETVMPTVTIPLTVPRITARLHPRRAANAHTRMSAGRRACVHEGKTSRVSAPDVSPRVSYSSTRNGSLGLNSRSDVNSSSRRSRGPHEGSRSARRMPRRPPLGEEGDLPEVNGASSWESSPDAEPAGASAVGSTSGTRRGSADAPARMATRRRRRAAAVAPPRVDV